MAVLGLCPNRNLAPEDVAEENATWLTLTIPLASPILLTLRRLFPTLLHDHESRWHHRSTQACHPLNQCVLWAQSSFCSKYDLQCKTSYSGPKNISVDDVWMIEVPVYCFVCNVQSHLHFLMVRFVDTVSALFDFLLPWLSKLCNRIQILVG